MSVRAIMFSVRYRGPFREMTPSRAIGAAYSTLGKSNHNPSRKVWVRAYVYYIIVIMIRRNVSPIKAEIRNWYTFEDSLEEVVHNAKYFFAWKDGILIGTYNTLGEATTSLASKVPKTTVRQSA
jgi:hypothetical protein